MAAVERTVHVTITGRVQGVGFRAWVQQEAVRRNLSGLARNRRDGSVEAVFAGSAADVGDMLAACQLGPGAAFVSRVDVTETFDPAGPHFTVLPTA